MLTLSTHRRPAVVRSLVAAAMCVAPGLLAAQAAAPASGAPAPDRAWQAWIGCWVPDAPDGAAASDSAAANLRVCVLPTTRASAVEVRRFAGARELRRDTVDASGERRTAVREGCRGWDQAEFSADRRRVFLHSEYACGPVTRVARGVLALTGGGAWLDVRSVSAAGAPPTVQVAQFRPAPATVAEPAELASVTDALGLSLDAARRAASAPLTADNVAEAVRKTDGSTVTSWIAASGQRFALDGQRLRALKAAGVPGEVTDMMVAVSNPRVFAISASDGLGTARSAERAERTLAQRQNGAWNGPGVWGMNPGLGAMGFFDPFWGSAFGFSPFGFNTLGFRNGLGWGPGFFPGGVFVGGAPVAVVRPPAQPAPQVRFGRGGYTSSGDADAGRPVRPRNGGPSTNSSPSSGSYGGGSAGAGASSAGSSGGSEGRAVRPRP